MGIGVNRDEEIGVEGVGARGPQIERDVGVVVAREQGLDLELVRDVEAERVAVVGDGDVQVREQLRDDAKK